MSIVLYGRKNCKGSSVRITRDYSDLKDTSLNYRTSSAELTGTGDKIVFYNERHWKGDAMFRSGRMNITDMGDPAEGGHSKFNNGVKSIRTTPFTVKVKYHFIYKDGELPGDHDGVIGLLTLAKHIDDLHQIAADIWLPYLVKLEKEPTVNHYNSAEYFDLELGKDEFDKLKADDDMTFANYCVNVVFVDDVVGTGTANVTGKADLGAMAKPVVVLELRPERLLFTNGRAIAHEIGHTFGLTHGTNSNNRRLMTQAGQLTGDIEDAVELSQAEAETVHTELAKNDERRPLLRVE